MIPTSTAHGNLQDQYSTSTASTTKRSAQVVSLDASQIGHKKKKCREPRCKDKLSNKRDTIHVLTAHSPTPLLPQGESNAAKMNRFAKRSGSSQNYCMNAPKKGTVFHHFVPCAPCPSFSPCHLYEPYHLDSRPRSASTAPYKYLSAGALMSLLPATPSNICFLGVACPIATLLALPLLSRICSNAASRSMVPSGFIAPDMFVISLKGDEDSSESG